MHPTLSSAYWAAVDAAGLSQQDVAAALRRSGPAVSQARSRGSDSWALGAVEAMGWGCGCIPGEGWRVHVPGAGRAEGEEPALRLELDHHTVEVLPVREEGVVVVRVHRQATAPEDLPWPDAGGVRYEVLEGPYLSPGWAGGDCASGRWYCVNSV